MTKFYADNCSYCGTRFNDVFEEADHLLDSREQPFNPSIILPGGYHLKVGTLLRYVYRNRNNPDKVSSVVQGAYVALLRAEKHHA